jgi:hypothetical protein
MPAVRAKAARLFFFGLILDDRVRRHLSPQELVLRIEMRGDFRILR